MGVHVGEVHTQVNVGPSTNGVDGSSDQRDSSGSASPPGVLEDAWRHAEGRVQELRRRVAAEGFDD